MGYIQPRVKLRLCEQLRIHAPHIFNKGQTNLPESPRAAPANFQSPIQPMYPVMPSFPQGQIPVPEPEMPSHIPVPPPPAPIPDNTLFSRTNLVWQGNIARNGKKLTETLAIQISGQCASFLVPSLETINITHRLKWEEASKNVPLAVFSIHSSNNLKIEPFLEYIEYFKSKNRIGVAPLGNDHNIYVCSPGNPLYDKHMPTTLTTPTLIGIVVAAENVTTPQPDRLHQSNGDWLNQLSTITAMLGTKK